MLPCLFCSTKNSDQNAQNPTHTSASAHHTASFLIHYYNKPPYLRQYDETTAACCCNINGNCRDSISWSNTPRFLRVNQHSQSKLPSSCISDTGNITDSIQCGVTTPTILTARTAHWSHWLRAGRQGFDSRQEQEFVSLPPLYIHISSGAQQSPNQWVLVVKRLEREAYHSSLPSSEDKNAWSFNTTPHTSSMALATTATLSTTHSSSWR
jgi:hypothetical protein